MPILFFLLLSSSTSTRKLLQDPFFPPSQSPPPSFSPFTNFPFFPQFPSPPPPPPPFPSSNQPTFPANLTSIIFPHSPTSPHHPFSSSAKLASCILLPSLTFLIFSLSLAILLRRRRHPPSLNEKSNFYFSSAAHSPELRPLPPLTRQLSNGVLRSFPSPSDEFFSPQNSSLAEFAAPTMAENETLSTTPSYPSSSSETRSPPLLGSRSSSRRFGDVKGESFASVVEKRADLEESEGMIHIQVEKKMSFDDSDLVEVKPLMGSLPPPPPPPPPPPRAGYWESKIRSVLNNSASIQTESPNLAPLGGDLENVEKNEGISRPKLKPLHWDKVRASSDRAMVWDQMKSSSFQVNEEMIESLFICNGNDGKSKETTTKQQLHLPLPKQENRVLDPKKSQNIAILLRALNVTKEEVCEALLEGNSENLGSELMETLLKMAPSKEEEEKLREYKEDDSSTTVMKLGPAEKFLMALIDIPFAFKRVDAMLYIINFDSEVNYLKDSFETLEAACEELRSSRLFLKLLEAVLKTGNRMNVGTARGDARSFKLDSLLKLADVKGGPDGKTTLLHFVLQEVTRSEGSRLSSSSSTTTPSSDLHHRRRGLQVVSNLSGELTSVKKSASMDSDVLRSYVSKLAGGLSKVKHAADLAAEDKSCRKFAESMNTFMKKGEDEIIRVQAQESVALSLVKEITEYFHGNSAKEEAHPFRIFTVVRDFLTVLDRVCKEVGKIADLSVVSAGRQFPVPVNPNLVPKLRALRGESSDEDGGASPLS